MKHKIIALTLERNVQAKDVVKNNYGYILGELVDEILPPTLWKPQQILLLNDKLDQPATPKHTPYYDGDGKIRSFGTGNMIGINSKNIIAAYPEIKGISKFQIRFIKEWVKNFVDEVEVEYVIYTHTAFFFKDGVNSPVSEYKLKLTENNEVICTIETN